MSDKNKKDEEKIYSIPTEIIEAISSVDQDVLFHSESCPPCPSENFDIAEILDGTKKKKEKEKEYKIGNYLIKKTLGQGTFGKVKLGIYLPSQEKVAIKILEKDRILEKDDEIRVKREFDMLALFNNPNVILVAEIFESSDSYYSVMEFCEGGELFNFIVKNRRLSEEEASFFYYQLISGLEYIHSLGIVHRDLKPENLLLTKDHLLKIIDFGLSNYFNKGQKELLVTPCGSPCYASPEMVAGKKYNGFKIDIWSTGIILYAMLCGYLPFEDKDNDKLFEKILECKLEFPKYITDLSKDLIKRILVTDPNKRIDIPEIKKHPFYLKGKEIFEQEFSICQIEKEDSDLNYDKIDLNNILDSSLLKSYDKENINENLIDKEQKKEDILKPDYIKEKDKELTSNKKRNKEKKRSINNFEQGNIIQRLNTEYDEKRSTLRNAILEGLNKGEKNEIKRRNNSTVKKNINRNGNNKNKNIKTTNKKNGPFKRRDIILLKNNKDNDKNSILKNQKQNQRIKPHDLRTNKKLIKTNNYNNINKNSKRKNNVGKSVNLRNRNYKNYNKNLIHRKINYTNIIQNKFNSKENLIRNKINKKDNIYINNINNTIDEDRLSKNNNLNFDFNFHYGPKKTRSMAKKDMKLNTMETAYNQKNKKYLDNLITINSSIKKYENKLNMGGIHNAKKNNDMNLKYYLFGKDNINQEGENNSKNNLKKGNKSKARKEKVKLTKNLNKTNPNINIIDNTQDDDNDSMENNTENIKINININSNIKKEPKNKISPKNNETHFKVNKDKYIKKNINKINNDNLLKHNSNLHSHKKNNIKLNYYLNEIEQKKTFDIDNNNNNKKHKHGINTDIIDNSEFKKSNNYNLRKKLINDYKKKSINNKTTIPDKESLGFHNKKGFILDNSIIKHNNGLNATIDSVLKTEPDKSATNSKKMTKNTNKNNNNINNEKHDKKQIFYKKISTPNTNNINPPNKNPKNNINKRQNIILSNNAKNLNKTSNNFNTLNHPIKNSFNSHRQNILEIINTSTNYNTNNNINKKHTNRKNSQIISSNVSNYKKPSVTIKNTVINLNIDTGFILSSVGKKRRTKKINSKRANNNSVSHINNKHLIGLEPKYNNYLTNTTIANINHSNTNENFPIKTKSININDNFNLISLNEDADSNNLNPINKNSNYQKIYIYGEKTAYKKNMKSNHIKDYKNDNNNYHKVSNNSTSIRDKKHMKYKSMKLDEFYEIKGRKKVPKNNYINTNETSFNIYNK